MATSTPAAAVLLLVVVAVITIGGLWTAEAAVSDVSNETALDVSVNQSTVWQDLGGPSNATRYTSPTVTNSSGELNASAYEFNNTDGSIRFASNVSEFADVQTTAQVVPENSGPILSALNGLFKLPQWTVLIGGAGAVLAALQVLNNGRRGGGPI